MFRQLKHDKRSFIYEFNPPDITVKANSSSADWTVIEKASSRIWICTKDQVKLIEKTSSR